MFGLFKKTEKRNFEQLFPELKPKDRIRRIILEYILPNLEKKGFKLLKSELILKRDLGDFQQEIFFKTSRRNSRDLCIKFDPHFFVKSKEYSKWYKKTYKEKIPNDYRISNSTLWASGNDIPNWGKTLYSYSWYDLLERDNFEIIQEINEKIEKVAIPYMNKHSEWNSAINMIMKRNSFTDTAMILDFCEMQNNIEKANEISHWYQTSVIEKGLKLNDEVKNEIEMRRKRIKNWAQQKI